MYVAWITKSGYRLYFPYTARREISEKVIQPLFMALFVFCKKQFANAGFLLESRYFEVRWYVSLLNRCRSPSLISVLKFTYRQFHNSHYCYWNMYSIEPESKCLYSYVHVRDAHIWSDVLYSALKLYIWSIFVN